MAENKEYFSKEVENGSIQISEEVVASVAAMAVLEVEGVCGLASNLGYDIAEMLGKKTLAKGVREAVASDGWIGIFTGGLTAAAGGVTAAVVAGVLMAAIFRPGDKR